jgi:hypothetical protein
LFLYFVPTVESQGVAFILNMGLAGTACGMFTMSILLHLRFERLSLLINFLIRVAFLRMLLTQGSLSHSGLSGQEQLLY